LDGQGLNDAVGGVSPAGGVPPVAGGSGMGKPEVTDEVAGSSPPQLGDAGRDGSKGSTPVAKSEFAVRGDAEHTAASDDEAENDAVEQDDSEVDDAEGDIEDDEDEDGDEDEQEAPMRCPYCNSERECEHQIFFWSACNGDWCGPLPDAVASVQQELVRTLWEARLLPESTREKLDYYLTELGPAVMDAPDDGDGGPDLGEWSSQAEEYWIEVAWDSRDCIVLRSNFDGGYPGSSDVFKQGYAKDPKATIQGVLECAQEHIAAVRGLISNGA
jgi:hypothetical protein